MDDLNGAWLPDVYQAYGDSFVKLGLSDTRTIKHEQRFMLTNNIYDPKIYQVTKIVELFPQGIIKMSLKQDELNLDRDNIELLICDYYTSNGEANHEHVINNTMHPNDIGVISQMIINSDGELERSSTVNTKLSRGVSSYYNVEFSIVDLIPNWDIIMVDNDKLYTDEEHDYYCGLLKLSQYNDFIVSIKPSKAKSLVGKKFILSAVDHSGSHYASIELEVL